MKFEVCLQTDTKKCRDIIKNNCTHKYNWAHTVTGLFGFRTQSPKSQSLKDFGILYRVSPIWKNKYSNTALL